MIEDDESTVYAMIFMWLVIGFLIIAN